MLCCCVWVLTVYCCVLCSGWLVVGFQLCCVVYFGFMLMSLDGGVVLVAVAAVCGFGRGLLRSFLWVDVIYG